MTPVHVKDLSAQNLAWSVATGCHAQGQGTRPQSQPRPIRDPQTWPIILCFEYIEFLLVWVLWFGIWGAFYNPIAILGMVLIVTGMVGYCPINQLLGKESCITPTPQDNE